MNITDYFKKLNDKSQEIFEQSLDDSDSLGKTHHLLNCIVEFSDQLSDMHEKELLRSVAGQLESSCLNMTLGLYRQAFSSLRLAFEMGLGVVYFSSNKLEHFEWMKGNADIKWSKLINEDNGVLSKRFSNAFFPELTSIIDEYNEKTSALYRRLSEFVHGNSETWSKSGLQLTLNKPLKKQFYTNFYEVSEIILFVLSCRYLKIMDTATLESMEFIQSELSHIPPIRMLCGGPKELK
ncbi:MAG: hypothetical protein EOO90_03725 [Pedobacter sp.]|nr:MAG: hypothetical protein EOO90_03725 [Pedobacter sp.]